MQHTKRTSWERFLLFAAEGFGSGRVGFAPGTAGTVAGFVWVFLLLVPANIWIYVAGIVVGFFGAVWLGGRGEEITGKKDPSSIVVDEISALPLAFLGAVFAESTGAQSPGFGHFLTTQDFVSILVAFAAFRFFDISKPRIIGRAQHLPGGWGLVVDDFLAAIPVIPLTYLSARFF